MEFLNGLTMARRRFSALAIPRSGPTLDADIASYVAVLEETRALSNAEKQALQDDKDRGVAHGWWSKMYDRVLLGWADAAANAVRQKTPASSITFTGGPTHSAGFVDFASSKYALLWAPTAAYASVDSMGMMFGLAADVGSSSSCLDSGVRTGVSTNANDLTAVGYGLAFASFGNTTTARISVSASSATKGFYMGHRTSATAGRLRRLLSGGSPSTLASSSGLSSGGLNSAAIALGAYNLNGGAVDNFSNRRYSQYASYDGLTNTEADDALIDALTTEIALGWRSAP